MPDNLDDVAKAALDIGTAEKIRGQEVQRRVAIITNALRNGPDVITGPRKHDGKPDFKKGAMVWFVDFSGLNMRYGPQHFTPATTSVTEAANYAATYGTYRPVLQHFDQHFLTLVDHAKTVIEQRGLGIDAQRAFLEGIQAALATGVNELSPTVIKAIESPGIEF